MVEGSSAEQLAFQPSLYLLALTTAVQQFGSNASFSLSLHTLSCLPPSANISLSLFLACSELVCSPPPPRRRPWLQSPTGSALRRLVSDSLLWGTDVCFSCCCKLRWRWWSHTFTHYHWVHSISPAVLFTATPSTSCSISSVCSINWRQRPQQTTTTALPSPKWNQPIWQPLYSVQLTFLIFFLFLSQKLSAWLIETLCSSHYFCTLEPHPSLLINWQLLNLMWNCFPCKVVLYKAGFPFPVNHLLLLSFFHRSCHIYFNATVHRYSDALQQCSPKVHLFMLENSAVNFNKIKFTGIAAR